MDDQDRQEILEHFQIADQNSHNAIKGLNEQIMINEYFNETMATIKNAVEQDRIKIKAALTNINKENSEIVRHLHYQDQMLKLKSI